MGSKKRFFGRGGNRKKRADRVVRPYKKSVVVRIAGDSERRCAERRDLSDGRDGWDGQRKAEIF